MQTIILIDILCIGCQYRYTFQLFIKAQSTYWEHPALKLFRIQTWEFTKYSNDRQQTHIEYKTPVIFSGLKMTFL